MSETIFYPDIYSGDAGINLKGAPVVCIKSTQGNTYVNPDYSVSADNARKDGVPHFAYHFLEKGNADAQADHCHSVVGSIPVMVDAETNPATNSGPSLDDICNFVDRLRKDGGAIHAVYLPHWYWQDLGSPDLKPLRDRNCFLVSSDYTAYSEMGPGWTPYGGMTPEVWQYSDNHPFGGKDVDFNAFKGQRRELLNLLVTGSREDPKHWQEWVSDGSRTLFEVARDIAHYPPATILRETAVHYGEFDGVIFANVNDLAQGNVTPIGKGGKLWVKI